MLCVLVFAVVLALRKEQGAAAQHQAAIQAPKVSEAVMHGGAV
jgi:hypothetical protein